MLARPRHGFAIALAAACAVICTAWEASAEQAKPPIPGMVRQTEIRIAPETTGRLATIAVTTSQHVHKGDLLAVLDNPELTAAVGEAKAAASSAKAERD